MKRYAGVGVSFVILSLIVATVFLPISFSSTGLIEESFLDSEDVERSELPLGLLMGGDPPRPLLTPPVIQFCDAMPTPQEVGSPVNITCSILDDLGVVNAWVEVIDSDGQVVGNFSMLEDPDTGFWYNETIYYKAGVHTYAVTAEDQEGQFVWSDGMGAFNFLMQDSYPPSITNVTATPSPQEIGQNVNITCNVTDNGTVTEVYVEVFDPSMGSIGNFSMIFESGDLWFYERAYLDIGTHTFTITAWDSGLNFNVSTGSFEMEDTTGPEISSVQEDPNPQQINGYVNISAIITDLDSVAAVRLRVVDPGMAEVGNWSMDWDSGTGRYYYNRSYSMIGTYNFEIWARDPTGNWNSYFGTFTILADVTPPTITGQSGTPDPQEVFFDVNITATITDNTAVGGAWVEIRDPLGGLVGNFTMIDNGGDLYSYEQAYDMLGTYTFIIWANDTYDWWSSASGSFVVHDKTIPVVDLITAIPDPQEVHFSVNISCRVTDNFAELEAWVEVSDPLGGLVGNFSMLFDSGTGRWSHEQAYDIIGTYTFVIWAADTSWNWGTNSGSFLMVDTTPPTITGTTATPNPQQSNSNVNITCAFTDNYQIFEAYVEVEDPLSVIVGNFSMLWDSIASQFYYEQAYWEIGEYNYTLWASDTSNNWDTAPGNFTIIDTTNPIISDVQRIPQPQEVHFDVNVSAVVTDNYMVQQVIIDIVDPVGSPVINTDMSYDSVNGRYYYTATYDMVGTYDCTLWTRDTMNNQDTTGCDFDMVDTTPPEITDLTNVPDPGDINLPMNVSAIVTDNYALLEVWYDVDDPFGSNIGNFTMLYDSGNGRFYYERSYTQLGFHSLTIWASDAYGNWGRQQAGFLIDDLTPPTISAMTEVPDPQEVYGPVNISAQVTDNEVIDWVRVEVRNKNDVTVGNFTMNYDPGSGRYYDERNYGGPLGVYFANITARDRKGNMAVAFGSFLVRDTTPPLIQNIVATPDPQDAGGLVRINADITDNFQLGLVYVEVLDPFSVLIINTTMTSGVPTHWYQQAYTELGTHTFRITAWDGEGNPATDTGSFEIYDVSPPSIGMPTETPDPQEVYGSVNVTVGVSDNYQVQSVHINITDPSPSPAGNFSMMDLGAGVFGYEQAYDMLGTYTCIIWAIDTSGNPSSRACSFRIRDNTPPTITDSTEDPQPQNVGGYVNISANVTDNFQLSAVRLEVIDPDSQILGNNTMFYDAGTERYYWNANYFKVGTYNYNIYAWDSSNKVGSYAGTFVIEDGASPTISPPQATPDPQEVHNNVRISATITDDDVVAGAWVEVTNPLGGQVGNFSMTDEGGGLYSHDQAYDMLGTYTYTIWASDPSNNWGTDGGSFVVHDKTPPDITNISTTSPQEVDVGAIDITATVTDNFDLSSDLQVWIDILYPDSAPFANVSMTYNAGNDKFSYAGTFQDELGTYVFVIWAVDGRDNWNNATGSFVIQDTADPIADAGPDQNVNQGDLVTFDGSGSSDNDPLFDTTGNFTWTFDDSGMVSIYGINPTYTFVRGGDYNVTLTVTDRGGNWGKDNVIIHVVAGPNPPTGLQVTDPTENTLKISWLPPATYTDGRTLPASDIKGYTIYRSASPDGPYTEVTFVTTLTHTDTGLTRNTTYYYKITCWSQADNIESEMTDWESGTTTMTPPPSDGEGEQDMMLYALVFTLIIVIVVVALVAYAVLRKKKRPEEELWTEKHEEDYYYEEDLPPPPPPPPE